MKSDINIFLKKIRFCFICGGNLDKKENNLLICSSCNFYHYINPKPCNAAILANSKGEILLVKRKYPPKKGYWDLPGGFVDLNENAEESMARELKEELGIKINNLKYFGSYNDSYCYGRNCFPTVSFVFQGVIGNQKLESKSDVQDLRFFSVKDVPFSQLAFESVRKAINEFLAL